MYKIFLQIEILFVSLQFVLQRYIYVAKSTHLCLLEVEDAGILLPEALIHRDDPVQKFLVQGQVGQGSQKPAISKLSLVNVKS